MFNDQNSVTANTAHALNRPTSSSMVNNPGNSRTTRRATKRAYPALNGGGDLRSENCDSSLNCLICRELFSEPHVTKCGHTFCQDCIVQHISANINKNCPTCGVRVVKEDLAPNFALNDMVQLKRSKQIKLRPGALSVVCNGIDTKEAFANSIHNFSLNEIDVLLRLLQLKKETLITESKQQQRNLTVYFLQELQRSKVAEKQALEQKLELINQDLNFATACSSSDSSIALNVPSSDSCADVYKTLSPTSSVPSVLPFGLDSSISTIELQQSSLSNMKKRISEHFHELSQVYFDCRNVEVFDPKQNDAQVPSGDNPVLCESLDTFGETLSRISRYHKLNTLATLSYSADLLNNSNIVSSIEFDRDSEYFAIAGVTKKIKLFEYATVVGSAVDIHCPSSELTCNAKISCIAWSGYFKNYLASSDYDGSVTLWDANTSQKNRSFNEHEKRVWSVDWSNGDPRFLASGSDDHKVRLWSTNTDRSVAQLEAKANVCCVKFCPKNTYYIAFGSADHGVHYYDFRNPKVPLGVLQGHQKAVSYVKFASEDELVSASTDSQLKLWNLTTMRVIRSFRGHTNEKNFVGLATDGNYIACGSENNSLYIYYKSLPKPLFSFKFDNHRSMLDRSRNEESTEFVSAVAWKKGSSVVVAANSQGAIKILELV